MFRIDYIKPVAKGIFSHMTIKGALVKASGCITAPRLQQIEKDILMAFSHKDCVTAGRELYKQTCQDRTRTAGSPGGFDEPRNRDQRSGLMMGLKSSEGFLKGQA